MAFPIHLLTCSHFALMAQYSGLFPLVLSAMLVSCFVFLLSRSGSLSPTFFVSPFIHQYIWNVFVNIDQTLRVSEMSNLNNFYLGEVAHKIDFSPFLVSSLLSFLGHFLMCLQVCSCVSEDQVFSTLLCCCLWKVALFWLLAELSRRVIWLTPADQGRHNALSNRIALVQQGWHMWFVLFFISYCFFYFSAIVVVRHDHSIKTL